MASNCPSGLKTTALTLSKILLNSTWSKVQFTPLTPRRLMLAKLTPAITVSDKSQCSKTNRLRRVSNVTRLPPKYCTSAIVFLRVVRTRSSRREVITWLFSIGTAKSSTAFARGASTKMGLKSLKSSNSNWLRGVMATGSSFSPIWRLK